MSSAIPQENNVEPVAVQPAVQPAVSQIERRAISDIRIGADRARRDMGDLEELGISILEQGLLHPIGIFPDGELVFGERRLRAIRDHIGWTHIDVRIVNVTSRAYGEIHENEMRKQFTPSERVAIFRSIETISHKGTGGRPKKTFPAGNVSSLPAVDKAAKLAGFAGRGTAYRAENVVKNGIPALVEAMDKGDIKITPADIIANLPKPLQQPAIDVEKAKNEAKNTAKKANKIKKPKISGRVRQSQSPLGRLPPGQRRKAVVIIPPEEPALPSDNARRAALLVIDTGKTQDDAAALTGVKRIDVRMAIAYEHGRRSFATLPEEERRQIATEAAKAAGERLVTAKQEKLAHRAAKRSQRRDCAPPALDRPLVMFDQQMWPLPAGSQATYDYDQFVFGANHFLAIYDLLRHRAPDIGISALAIELRTRLKFLRLMIDRRFLCEDDKREMRGFIQVYEILCDRLGSHPQGHLDRPFDICIMRENY
jgi:ParB-like chromosome segregation protein Spo0J